MKRSIFKNIIAVFAAAVALTACYEDKGNYDYDDEAVATITIEGLPETMTIAQKVDEIVLKPVVTSSKDGVIDENNENFEFSCKFLINSGYFADGEREMDINPDHKKDITFKPEVKSGTCVVWYRVTDKRTGVSVNHPIDVSIVSTTSNGWMVLCDQGDDNLVRLDMVSVLGEGREAVITDLLGPDAQVRHNANAITAYAFYQYNNILISTDEGGSWLNDDLTTSKQRDTENDFIVPPAGQTVTTAVTYGHYCQYRITDKGNIYAIGTSFGSTFEEPINTNVSLGAPTYQVAQSVGAIPNYYCYSNCAMFYDITNNRFMGRYNFSNALQPLQALEPEAQPLAEDNIKKFIKYYPTTFGGERIYSVLESANGERYVYGHDVSGASVAAITLDFHKKITAPGFNTAKYYAFHSQYPYVAFDNGNKVDLYNILEEKSGTGVSLPANEVITMVKGNIFCQDYSQKNPEFNKLNNTILVGSYDKADPVHGGVLRIYNVVSDGVNAHLELVKEYKGFAKIKDVCYRESYMY